MEAVSLSTLEQILERASTTGSRNSGPTRAVLLARTPRIGREFSEFSHGLFGFPVKNYLIFYEIMDDGIVIARVLNAKRDIPVHFQ